MKILYVIHDLHIGGAEKIVASYALKLKEKGENICLLELFHHNSYLSDEISKSGIAYYTLISNNIIERVLQKFNPIFFKARFNKLIKQINPDIVHFQTLTQYMLVMDFPMNRCLYTFHSRLDRTLKKGSWVYDLFGQVAKRGMVFISISSLITDDIGKLFPYSKRVSIPNGINLNNIRQYRNQRESVRKELGISPNTFVIGQVGRFNTVKNHVFTIKVFQHLLQIKKDSLLILIGDGSVKETETIKDQTIISGVQDKVMFLGLRKDPERIMTCFDVLFHPSISESFSLVLIEAQANNVRCVASDAIPNEVFCNSNCVQLPLDAPLSHWVSSVLHENNNTKSKNIEIFNLENVIDEHINLYKSLLR